MLLEQQHHREREEGGGQGHREVHNSDFWTRSSGSPALSWAVLDAVQEVGDRRVLDKLTSMLDHDSHPLQDTLSALERSFSDRVIHPGCVKEQFHRSFLPAAVRLYSEYC